MLNSHLGCVCFSSLIDEHHLHVSERESPVVFHQSKQARRIEPKMNFKRGVVVVLLILAQSVVCLSSASTTTSQVAAAAATQQIQSSSFHHQVSNSVPAEGEYIPLDVISSRLCRWRVQISSRKLERRLIIYEASCWPYLRLWLLLLGRFESSSPTKIRRQEEDEKITQLSRKSVDAVCLLVWLAPASVQLIICSRQPASQPALPTN